MADDQSYRAVVIREQDSGFTWNIEDCHQNDLPPGDLLINVRYSSLNYKDALSATGNRGVTRNYPHTPGIDSAGVVVQSSVSDFSMGQEVLVTGYDLGQNTPGGWGEYIRVPAAWAVPLPSGMSLKESMVFGTAGFTAAQCVERIVNHPITPTDGEVLVTGATGGVGCLALALLAKLGYDTVAATGKKDRQEWLRSLGANRVIGREEVADQSGKPLLSRKWVAVVDTVGGPILETVLRQTSHRGIVTAVGNAGGAELNLTVYPFILRGVTLAGVDSAACPENKRNKIWSRLAGDWKITGLDTIIHEVDLDGLEAEVHRILEGKIAGRVVVRHAN